MKTRFPFSLPDFHLMDDVAVSGYSTGCEEWETENEKRYEL